MKLYSESIATFDFELEMDHKLIRESVHYPRGIIRFLDVNRHNVDARGQEPIDAVWGFMALAHQRKHSLSDRALIDQLGTNVYVQAFCGFTKVLLPRQIFARSSLPNIRRRFPEASIRMVDEFMAGGTPVAAKDDATWNRTWEQIFEDANDGIEEGNIPERKIPNRKLFLILCENERERISRLDEMLNEMAARKAEELRASLNDTAATGSADVVDPLLQFTFFAGDPDLVYTPFESAREVRKEIVPADEATLGAEADAPRPEVVPGTDPVNPEVDEVTPAEAVASQAEVVPVTDPVNPEAEEAPVSEADVPQTESIPGARAAAMQTEAVPGTDPVSSETEEVTPAEVAVSQAGAAHGAKAVAPQTQGTPASGSAISQKNVQQATDSSKTVDREPVKQKHYMIQDVIPITEIQPICERLQIPVVPKMKILELCDILQDRGRFPVSEDARNDIYFLLLQLAEAMSTKIRRRDVMMRHNEDIEALGSATRTFVKYGEKAIIDATVAPSHIAYPTDAGLLNHGRLILEGMIHVLWIDGDIPSDTSEQELPYPKREAQNVFLSLVKDKGGWTKAKMTPIIRKLLDYLWRAMDRFMELRERFPDVKLRKATESRVPIIYYLLEQQTAMYMTDTRRCPDRIVSIYQPFVRPIFRGKLKNPTEFGLKLHLMDVSGHTFLLKSDWDNFPEGTELKSATQYYYDLFQCLPDAVLGDLAYKTRINSIFCRCLGIRFSGALRGMKPDEAAKADKDPLAIQDARDRSIIEGRNGTVKVAYGLGLEMCILEPFQRSAAATSVLVMNVANDVARQIRKEKELEREILNGRRRPYRKTVRH